MADSAGLDPEERAGLDTWLEQGGVLLRFAGPKLASSSDDLVPARLRAGDRILGGALSWSEPLALAPFPPESPFAGLPVTDEVRVSRQVLAEPGPDLAAATMASLSTARRWSPARERGKGWLILVHTTANTAWTSLPLSGLFVQMLERVLALGPGVGGTERAPLEPNQLLDAFGRLDEPAAALAALGPDAFADGRARVRSTRPASTPRSAEQAGDGDPRPPARPSTCSAPHRPPTPLEPRRRRRLARVLRPRRRARPCTVAGARRLLLALADLARRSGPARPAPGRSAVRAGAAALLLALPAAAPVQAQDGGDDARIVELTRETRLAYVLTGRADIDQESEAGLKGLTRVLAMRTSIEAADPVAVDVAADDLALFPLLYWPIPPDHPDLAPGAVERVEAYLAPGRHDPVRHPRRRRLLPGQEGGGPGEQRLAELLHDIDLPPLIPLPADHVLTRSFYLLQDFPGRWTGQPLWVDQAAPGINDGVSGRDRRRQRMGRRLGRG